MWCVLSALRQHPGLVLQKLTKMSFRPGIVHTNEVKSTRTLRHHASLETQLAFATGRRSKLPTHGQHCQPTTNFRVDQSKHFQAFPVSLLEAQAA